MVKFWANLLLVALAATPSLAQANGCGCRADDDAVVVAPCAVATPCESPRWRPVWHRPYHPHPWHPSASASAGAAASAASASSVAGWASGRYGARNGVSASGNTVNVYTMPTATLPTANPTYPAPNPAPPSDRDITALNQRLDMIGNQISRTDGWIGKLGWLAALLALLLLLPLLLLALWALLGSRNQTRGSDSDARHWAEAEAKLQASLRQKDREIARISDEVERLRREVTREHSDWHTDVDHTHTEHRQPHRRSTAVIEEVGVVETGAAAAVGAAAVAVPAAHHRAAAAPAHHTTIDEADWTIADYHAAIGEARARTHDRPKARQDIIRLSDHMLARYPHHAEAASFAAVSKADAQAENGEYEAAFAGCESVIAQHGDKPAARAHVAHAHFTKAAIYAAHKQVAACCVSLDQWASVRGTFDTAQVTQDVRFKAIIKVTEFREYLARKSA